ncbi:unnamed protein product [Linum trigynum]|uniref:Uncharacterized protein n=1 Tax=Linum trigynum TaxID=586398 RepID=A0AAV2E2S7_9ROSI
MEKKKRGGGTLYSAPKKPSPPGENIAEAKRVGGISRANPRSAVLGREMGRVWSNQAGRLKLERDWAEQKLVPDPILGPDMSTLIWCLLYKSELDSRGPMVEEGCGGLGHELASKMKVVGPQLGLVNAKQGLSCGPGQRKPTDLKEKEKMGFLKIKGLDFKWTV